jgi:hypothetical protein
MHTSHLASSEYRKFKRPFPLTTVRPPCVPQPPSRWCARLGSAHIPIYTHGSLIPSWHHGGTSAQDAAAKTLKAIGKASKEETPQLAALLNDSNWFVRMTAAEILGAMGETAKEQAPHLVPLLKAPEADVRRAAVEEFSPSGRRRSRRRHTPVVSVRPKVIAPR